MLNNISWQSFWISIALTTTVYYLTIFLIYFPGNFKIFWSQGSLFISKERTGSMQSYFPPEDAIPEERSRSEEIIVYACIDEVKALFEQFKCSKGVRQEIVKALQQVLNKYSTLKDSPFRPVIDHMVVFQADQICSIRLSNSDMDDVWIS